MVISLILFLIFSPTWQVVFVAGQFGRHTRIYVAYANRVIIHILPFLLSCRMTREFVERSSRCTPRMQSVFNPSESVDSRKRDRSAD